MSSRKIAKEDIQVREYVISNPTGIHARPAAMFVKVANAFDSEILVEKDGERVNGKSIMGLMMLAAGPGSKLRVHAQGVDALEALEKLGELIDNKFQEK